MHIRVTFVSKNKSCYLSRRWFLFGHFLYPPGRTVYRRHADGKAAWPDQVSETCGSSGSESSPSGIIMIYNEKSSQNVNIIRRDRNRCPKHAGHWNPIDVIYKDKSSQKSSNAVGSGVPNLQVIGSNRCHLQWEKQSERHQAWPDQVSQACRTPKSNRASSTMRKEVR